MTSFLRTAGLAGLLLAAAAPAAPAATQKEIDQAIKAGTEALKARYGRAAPAAIPGGGGNDPGHGVGPTCLTGLALLEAGVPANDPAVKLITDLVRNAAYTQTGTYQVSLCLMYLDRLGDPADAILIQILGVRLLVGQTNTGGWGYQCCGPVAAEDDKLLRGLRGAPAAGKLHADVERYAQALTAARAAGAGGTAVAGDDNSNTQFGALAVWMARKHGVPVENALDLVEKRFMASQDPRTGIWPYNGTVAGAPVGGVMMGGGSPAMYCAGLIGMATAVARHEEKRKPEPPRPKTDPKADGKPADPFYNPPAPAAVPPKTPPKTPPPARAADERDRTVQRAFAGLGLTLADMVRGGKGLLTAGGTHGVGDLYFLWSLERVGVVFGVDKIGGIDWYDAGSTAIVRSQAADGTWAVGGYLAEVNTAFAVLFLCRSNLARDLSGKVQKDPTTTEMRAGTGPAAADVLPGRLPSPAPAVPVVSLPNPTGDEGIALASKLLKAPDADWPKLLIDTRDAKGPTHTRALAVAAAHAEGDRKKAAREALAERLCRMTAATLRALLKAEDPELRRAAALACAMKDERAHVPDLIGALQDPDDAVVRAAKAGLKSLTGKDFGPAAGGGALSAEQKAQAAAAWRDWYAKEKK